jgi:hypothetical protein
MARSLVWAPAVLVLVLAVAMVSCGHIGYDELDVEIDAVGDAEPGDGPGADGLAACPVGTVETCPGSTVCVEVAERGYQPWTDAHDACLAVGRRLCTDAEWALACTCAVGLEEMTDDGAGSALEWEWVAEESGGVAQKRGYDTCDATSTHAVTDPYDFRCCVDR